MKSKDFFNALDMMAAEKGIDPADLAEKIKTAIILAVRKQYNGVDKVNVIFDPESTQIKVSYSKMVVDEITDPTNEMLIDEAKNYSKRAKVGEPVEILVDSKRIGRIAAQAAKQQIRQGVREVEREQRAAQMEDKVGEIISAKVEKVDPISKNALLNIDDENQVMLFANEQLPTDNFQPGDRVKVYAVDVSSTERRCTLKLSRTHPGLIRRLLEMEVPEIYSGLIEIKGIAREAGFRTKVSVAGNQENLDPVGSCIGEKGIRINQIVQELGGEKIDVIPYKEDAKEYIKEALSPAKVVEIEVLEDENKKERVAFVSVPDSQLSLAIGNRGRNAKLAARLTGYKIDISPESGFYGEDRYSSLKEKLAQRIAQKEAEASQTQSKEEPFFKRNEEEINEEYDIHCIEIEQMLESQDD